MIRCEVKVCATISRAASVKESKEGTKCFSFGVKLPVDGRNGETKDLDVGVVMDDGKGWGDEFAVGQRVVLTGTMALHKRNGEVHFYLRAESIQKAAADDCCCIKGTMDFHGKLSKAGGEDKTDKNGCLYKSFSAFSCDKGGGDKMEFTWVRFLWFSPDASAEILKPGAYVEAKGDLRVGVYRDAVVLDCMVSEVLPWENKKSVNE